jgi:hypothetical protein
MRYPIENLDWYMEKLREIATAEGLVLAWIGCIQALQCEIHYQPQG